MRRLSKVEKILIATSTDRLTTYDCKEHGILQLAVKRESAVCPWCKQPLQQVQGVEDLKRQYRKELGFE